jgi:hypothetical protein
MTEQPLTDDELQRLGDGGGQREPCNGCGVRPVLRSDGLHHYWHKPDCGVAKAITRSAQEHHE